MRCSELHVFFIVLVFFSAFFLLLTSEMVLSARQCGDLTCYALPGVETFVVRCKKKTSIASSFDSSPATHGVTGRKHAVSKSTIDSAAACLPVVKARDRIVDKVKEMGSLWDFKMSGLCEQKGALISIDSDAFSDKRYLYQVRSKGKRSTLFSTRPGSVSTLLSLDVCIPPSKTRFLLFDMREGFANQIMSMVYAAHIAQRLGFVLVLPEDIDARKSMSKTDLLFRSNMRAPLSSLFDVPNLEKHLAAINVQSQSWSPEQPGLQYVRLQVPRRSDYVEYMDKLGALALSGDNLIVDVGNLFLSLTAASCGTHDELASALGAITASFRRDLSASAEAITEKLSRLGSPRKAGTYNAIHLRIEEDSSVWPVTKEVSKTWEERIKRAGFSTREPVYVACGDSCASKASTYEVYHKNSFPDLLPRVQNSQDAMAVIDYLVLAKSKKFAGSLFSAFSHMVVTAKRAHGTYEIYAHDAKRFSQGGDELAYGSATPRQPCLGSADEDLIAATDVGHSAELITWRREHLVAHGVRWTSITDVLVVLELFQQEKSRHAFKALQIALGYDDATESPQAKEERTCAFTDMHPLPGYALQRHLNVDCRNVRTARPPKILFVTHSLRIEGAQLMMQFLLEYLIRVLHVELHILAPKDSCDQPLRAALLDLGVRQVKCQAKLYPEGYDAIYINTIVAWFDPPRPSKKNSWLDRTIWWVHESIRDELFPRYPNTPKLLPLARSRIYVSNATRSVYADIGQDRDWTIYNALDAEDKFLNSSMAALRERTRRTVFNASRKDVVFILLGTVFTERRQLEFVRAASKMMRDNPAAPCRFVLVGLTGQVQEAEDKVAAAVRESPFAERFMLMEKKDHDTAVKLLSAADVLVSVSDDESFGMTLLEGMTAGLPLIVQKVDGVPEVAYNAALDADPKDINSFASALQSMLNPRVRADHRAYATQKASFFDKSVFYTKHVLALNEVLG